MTMQRWTHGDDDYGPCETGEWVRFTDAETALAAERTARLAAEADPLQKWRALTARAETAEAALAAKDAEIARLREALAWYADPERYRPHPHGIAFDRRDISYVARAALEDTP